MLDDGDGHQVTVLQVLVSLVALGVVFVAMGGFLWLLLRILSAL